MATTRTRRLLVTAVVVVTGALIPASPAWAASWSVVSTPNATAQNNTFNGVDAVDTGTAWAVGSADTGATPATRPAVARWDGTAWSPVTTPTLAGSAALHAVDASSAGDVWAVGAAGSGTLAERWNGNAWSVVASPTPAGAMRATLRGVKTFGSNDAWAVGDAFTSGPEPQLRTVITRWNGTAWGIVPSPDPDPRQNMLAAVDGVSPTDVWAVGNIGDDGYGGQTTAGLLLRWNGTSWSRVTIPGFDSTFSIIQFHDIAVLSSTNVWIVGRAFHRGMLTHVPYVLRWNGQTWQHGTIPNAPGDSGFLGVAALSSTQVYAVGRVGSGSQTLVALWNGSAWSRESTPAASGMNALRGAAATGTGTVWAVGYQYNSSWVARTFALRTTNG